MLVYHPVLDRLLPHIKDFLMNFKLYSTWIDYIFYDTVRINVSDFRSKINNRLHLVQKQIEQLGDNEAKIWLLEGLLIFVSKKYD